MMIVAAAVVLAALAGVGYAAGIFKGVTDVVDVVRHIVYTAHLLEVGLHRAGKRKTRRVAGGAWPTRRWQSPASRATDPRPPRSST